MVVSDRDIGRQQQILLPYIFFMPNPKKLRLNLLDCLQLFATLQFSLFETQNNQKQSKRR